MKKSLKKCLKKLMLLMPSNTSILLKTTYFLAFFVNWRGSGGGARGFISKATVFLRFTNECLEAEIPPGSSKQV